MNDKGMSGGGMNKGGATEDNAIDDQVFMARALALAEQAAAIGEVPVGAVLVRDGEVLGEGYNSLITRHDPTAHAEIVAMRAAAQSVENYRLPGSTLYVTLEPCSMCCGAMVHARVETLVFATREPKAGAVVSTSQLLENPALNHRVAWREGTLAAESAACLRSFFRARRG